MKTTIVLLLVVYAAGFSAAAAAHALGWLGFDVLTPAGIGGALVVAGLHAFVGWDYRRKPSFRVRRGAAAGPRPELPPNIPTPDWTYTTRAS